MRRIGMALCALAILCQVLAMPMMAMAASDDTNTTGQVAGGSDVEEYKYKNYLADHSGNPATESIEIPAIDANDTGMFDEDATDEDVTEPETPEEGTPDAETPEEDAPAVDGEENGEEDADEATPVIVSAKAVADEPVTKTEDALIFNKLNAQASWSVSVPKTGWYTVAFTYSGVEGSGSGSDMEMTLLVNDLLPYAEAKNFVLPRTWVDAKEDYNNDGTIDSVREDTKGNQFAPEQKEVFDPKKVAMRDVDGFVSEDLCLYLEAGEVKLTLISTGEPIALYSLHLDVPTELKSYADQLKAWEAEGVKNYTGDEFFVEAELAYSKTDRAIIGLSDNSNPAVVPADAFTQKVNYIGGSNWSMSDESITWKVKAPAAGLYKVGFHYRQNYLVNATSYRSLKVNGKAQYAEMAGLGFDYKNNWGFMESFANGEDILVYLNEGENEVTLTVTLGAMNEFSAQLEELSEDLAAMYRAIVAITGETPDKNTDYELFQRIPNLEKDMKDIRSRIADMIESRRVGGKDMDDNAAMLKKMDVVLERMLKKQYEAQNYKSNFYDCYSSLTAQLQDMKNMALDLDVIVFASPENESFERNAAGFFEKLWFSIQRFIASFLLDYNTAGGVGGNVDLTIWVNWSRDQTLVLNSLINSRFTAEHPEINVTVRMTNASLLQGIMSGNGPDCSLSDARTTPVNLAMRGALVDLSKFEDYSSLFYEKGEAYDIYNEENTKYFAYGSDEPYKYNGGVYGLPANQQFYMLFYRTDIFEQYGLEVPKTWDDFIEVAGVLMLNNMQVGLPYVALTDIGQTSGGVAALNIFPTLLQQQGLSLYNEDQTGTSFSDPEVMRVFKEWTDFYTKYSIPKEYSFFNRFRIGLVPMAIQGYGQYSALSAAAPEIKGKWAMAEIPGYPVLDEEGNYTYDENGEMIINNSQAGFGSACMILKDSEHQKEAWELLKWWMSTDTQYRYALDIESILGVAGRYSSANVNATLKLDWGKGAEQIIAGQWAKVQEIAEIPGGYYVSRAIDQAFWNVLTMNENPKDMMKKWGEVADVEITTKIEQYKKEEEEGEDK